MIVRPLKPSDIPTLRKFYEDAGFSYEFPQVEKLEACLVVADIKTDIPLMAVGAERLIQLYLFCPQDGNPASKLHMIRMLHQAMSVELRRLGYNSAEAFLPPSIAVKFGRRLERTFGWWKNRWSSWTINF